MSKPQNLDSVPTVELPQEQPDLSEPTLAGLAWLLRHQPEGRQYQFDGQAVSFVWNFQNALEPLEYDNGYVCKTAGCAMGLAWMVWGRDYKSHLFQNEPRLTNGAFHRLFVTGYRDRPAEITPTVVADRIDDFLSGRPIRYVEPRSHP